MTFEHFAQMPVLPYHANAFAQKNCCGLRAGGVDPPRINTRAWIWPPNRWGIARCNPAGVHRVTCTVLPANEALLGMITIQNFLEESWRMAGEASVQ